MEAEVELQPGLTLCKGELSELFDPGQTLVEGRSVDEEAVGRGPRVPAMA